MRYLEHKAITALGNITYEADSIDPREVFIRGHNRGKLESFIELIEDIKNDHI